MKAKPNENIVFYERTGMHGIKKPHISEWELDDGDINSILITGVLAMGNEGNRIVVRVPSELRDEIILKKSVFLEFTGNHEIIVCNPQV